MSQGALVSLSIGGVILLLQGLALLVLAGEGWRLPRGLWCWLLPLTVVLLYLVDLAPLSQVLLHLQSDLPMFSCV